MSTDTRTADEAGDATERSREELLAELELLIEENDRLRESYARAKQTQYRRTAGGLAGLGLLAALGGLVIPTAQTVLFVLGATGLFGGVLTAYLTPEQFVAADVGQAVYRDLAANEAALVSELGLTDTRVYVPRGAQATSTRLFVPQQREFVLPSEQALSDRLVVPDTDAGRGLALTPAGASLFESFETALRGPLGESPEAVASQLTDAVVEQFELAGSATVTVDESGTSLTVGISDSVYGPLDRFDHPVVSLLAVGLARALDQPVTATVEEADTDRADYLVVCRWDEPPT